MHINFNFLKSNLIIFTCTEQLKLGVLFGFYLDSPPNKAETEGEGYREKDGRNEWKGGKKQTLKWKLTHKYLPFQ